MSDTPLTAGRATPQKGTQDPAVADRATSDKLGSHRYEKGELVTVKIALLKMAAELGEGRLVATLKRGDLLTLNDAHPRSGGKVFYATVFLASDQTAVGRVGVVRTEWIEPTPKIMGGNALESRGRSNLQPTGAQPTEPPPLSASEAFDIIDRFLRDAIRTIESRLAAVTNRSKLFTDQIEDQKKYLGWLEKTLDEGRQLVARAETRGATNLEGASARYEAVWIVAKVIHLDVEFLTMADAAENAGVGWPHIEQALRTNYREMSPLLNSVVGFNRRKMEMEADRGEAKFQAARKYLETWSNQLGLGTYWSKTAIAFADAFLIVGSIYKLGTVIKGGRGGPPLSFTAPVPGALGGAAAATGISIQVRAEVIEGIRKLIELGAITIPVLALGTGPNVTLPSAAAGPSSSLMSAPGTRPQWWLRKVKQSDVNASRKGYQAYMLQDRKGIVLYVGKAGGAHGVKPHTWVERIREHITERAKAHWIGEVDRITITAELTEQEVFALEQDLIRQHKPLYNLSPGEFRTRFPQANLAANLQSASKKPSFLFETDIVRGAP